MKEKQDMKRLLWGVYPMVKIFQITSTLREFEAWLQEEHQKSIDANILHGYKFFLECTFQQMFSTVYTDSTLEIKNDFLLDSAGKETFYLGKLPNTCPKTVFLKNIYFHFKPIQKAKDSNELVNAIKDFQEKVICLFEKAFKGNIKIKKHKNLSEKQVHNFFLIEKVFLFFNQINNNGPYAYSGELMKKRWIPEEKLDICFEGYKYAVQFTWRKLLGVRKYNKSCLQEIHKTEAWRGYIYNEQENGEDDDYIRTILNQTFDIDKQTSFNAFFYRIQKEIIHPLEKEHKIFITKMADFFISKKRNYSKTVFNNLFQIENAKEETRTFEEDLDLLLYWYPVEIIEPVTDNEVPVFITMLYGAVGLLKEKEKELRKVIVCKFVHPKEEGSSENDYSYGVLVDAKAAVGWYTSGWIIYYDCCGDYSGGSGSQHKRAEDVITKFKSRGILELREYKIGHNQFRKYIARYIREKSQNIKESVAEIESRLEEGSEKKKENTLIVDSQGLLLELFSYYHVTKKEKYSKYKEIKWNDHSVAAGEIDIIMQNDSDIHLIECKLNPHTLNFDKEISKIKRKLDNFEKRGSKTFEFWFWYEPNDMAKESLRNKEAGYFSFEENGISIPPPLKAIFNHKVHP